MIQCDIYNKRNGRIWNNTFFEYKCLFLSKSATECKRRYWCVPIVISKCASQFSRCADSAAGLLYRRKYVCAKSWKQTHKRGKTTRGPEAGINDGTCGTRSSRYCRPEAIVASRARERKRDRKRRSHPNCTHRVPLVRHRLLLVMRPGYYLFPLVCAHESSRQTNNLPFQEPPSPFCHGFVSFSLFASISFAFSAYVFVTFSLPLSLSLSQTHARARVFLFRGIDRREKGLTKKRENEENDGKKTRDPFLTRIISVYRQWGIRRVRTSQRALLCQYCDNYFCRATRNGSFRWCRQLFSMVNRAIKRL